MLQLTTAATDHLIRVRDERGRSKDSAARFVSKGARVGLTFAAKPGPKDHVIEGAGIAVYLAPEVAEKLENAVIDASVDEGRAILVMRRHRERTKAGSTRAKTSATAKATPARRAAKPS
jgi:Fe-S cluster assembly iron-binding protein IscA